MQSERWMDEKRRVGVFFFLVGLVGYPGWLSSGLSYHIFSISMPFLLCIVSLACGWVFVVRGLNVNA